MVPGFAGLQVRTGTTRAATPAGVIVRPAMFCAERARASSTVMPLLDWQARSDLARKWAAMPGSATVDPDAVYACSGKLPS